MCPFILFTFICWIFLLILQLSSAVITITFQPATLNLTESKTADSNYIVKCSSPDDYGTYKWVSYSPKVADLVDNDRTSWNSVEVNSRTCSSGINGTIRIRAYFLGYSHVGLKKEDQDNNVESLDKLKVRVTRDKDLISKIFVASIIVIVCLACINMGSALDVHVVVEVLKRPVAPAIGIFCQYIVMPLLSFGLGALLFDEPFLRLGLFIFGCSPGGGASNMWTVLLNGNLNLSITMTFISTLFSFGVMPFWLYTLGRVIYANTTISPPVRSILTTLLVMFVCLAIGLLNKRFFPRVANLSRRILAPFSVAMIIFIIVFGTYANFYMFKVMTWQIFLATAANVWAGMTFGLAISLLCNKTLEDAITIAIETGVQNTGVSITVLAFLGQPDTDLASAVPVAASIMTPIPLTLAYICLKAKNYYRRKHHTAIFSSESLEVCNGKTIKNDVGLTNGVVDNICSIDAPKTLHYDLDEHVLEHFRELRTGNV